MFYTKGSYFRILLIGPVCSQLKSNCLQTPPSLKWQPQEILSGFGISRLSQVLRGIQMFQFPTLHCFSWKNKDWEQPLKITIKGWGKFFSKIIIMNLQSFDSPPQLNLLENRIQFGIWASVYRHVDHHKGGTPRGWGRGFNLRNWLVLELENQPWKILEHRDRPFICTALIQRFLL